VPTLDEVERLPVLLDDLRLLDARIVVADGHSRDGTAELARERGVRVVRAGPGRGVQLRAGAAAAETEWLFFVHADSRISSDVARQLSDFVRDADPSMFAHFRFALDRRDWLSRTIETGQRFREQALGLVYGDQGLVVHRDLYDRARGYPSWPIMEDVGMIDRLSVLGRRVALEAPLVTSVRRYEEEGAVRAWTRNLALITLFRLGLDPVDLARWYRPHRRRPLRPDTADPVGVAETPMARTDTSRNGVPRSRRCIGVFAKAPTPGRVKTRLAADLGDERATDIYRRIGRGTVDSLRGGPYRLIVFFDPPDEVARAAVESWLGPKGLELRPQSSGDLGTRMTAALGVCLEEADAACLVGTDIPDLGALTAERAFEALANDDIVVGPATDGGYYLIGMTRPQPDLFAEVPWSTSRVLSETLARAERRGLTVALLDPKTDVDRVADVPLRLLESTRREA